jgi:hypothetical protein
MVALQFYSVVKYVVSYLRLNRKFAQSVTPLVYRFQPFTAKIFYPARERHDAARRRPSRFHPLLFPMRATVLS